MPRPRKTAASAPGPAGAVQRWLAAADRWWRARQREPIAEPLWQAVRGQFPFLQRCDAQELAQLRDLAERFLRRKHIQGAGGLAVTPAMRAAIAVQACVPILHLGLHWYRGWYSVIVYPDDFVAPFEYTDEDGIVHAGERELSGESWPQGPVILSWGSSTQADDEIWGNVVIHEFAHKLDMLNGDANGQPPLHAGMSARAWAAAFGEAYEDFCERVDRGDDWLPMDEYAAEDPAEFFAVASECFFIDPDALRTTYPPLYAQLEAFYRPRTPAPG